MRKLFFFISIQALLLNFGNAQTFQVDTLSYKGDIEKHLNLLIMGDGYTSTQQDGFIKDATNLSNYLFTQAPWSNYINYFNVIAIRVISSESGVTHPKTASDCDPNMPISSPNTYLGCSFDTYGIHRLVAPTNTVNIVNVLATNFPSYDIVFIISNTTYYGGSGGAHAVTTLDPNSPEVTVHELGHTFGNLADEYFAGDMYLGEFPNMTMQTDPSLVKWKNWMGFNGVGIYQHCCGGQSAEWYKPHNNCKMQFLDAPFCNVCSETIIEKIHALVNPIAKYSPTTTTVSSTEQYIDFELPCLIKPVPNTLTITWKLDGTTILNGVDFIKIDQNTLTPGTHTLTATVFDDTSLVRSFDHSTFHFNVITWTIEKTDLSIDLVGTDNKVAFSVFPNPSSDILNISVESDRQQDISIEIYSLDGRMIQHVTTESPVDEKFLTSLNIEHLASGTYIVSFKLGDIRHTQQFIKQ